MSREAFLARGAQQARTQSHLRSKKQEKELAKRTRGRLTPGSGNGFQKGDVRVKGIARIEAKTTKHSSFSVTLDMVRKIEDAATACNELPIIVVEFTKNGRKIAEVAVTPTYVLDQLR